MIQDGHSERQELVAEMTVRLGKNFEHLCRRAVDQGLEYPLELSYYTCSGSMIPDTNVGGNIATINEVSDDQKATFFFS